MRLRSRRAGPGDCENPIATTDHCFPSPVTLVVTGFERNSRTIFKPIRPARPTAVLVKTRPARGLSQSTRPSVRGNHSAGSTTPRAYAEEAARHIETIVLHQ